MFPPLSASIVHQVVSLTGFAFPSRHRRIYQAAVLAEDGFRLHAGGDAYNLLV